MEPRLYHHGVWFIDALQRATTRQVYHIRRTSRCLERDVTACARYFNWYLGSANKMLQAGRMPYEPQKFWHDRMKTAYPLFDGQLKLDLWFIFNDPTLATDNDDRRFDRRFDESSDDEDLYLLAEARARY